MHKPPTINRTTISIVALSFVTIMLFFAARIGYLQLYCHDEFVTLSQKNFLREVTIHPRRGNILDCHGNLLATNRPITNLSWQGTGKRTLSPEQLQLLATLTDITKIPLTDPELLTSLLRVEKHQRQQLLITDLPLACLSKIVEQFPQHPNLVIETSFKRHYPYNMVASHILGYIGRFAMIGQMGLEKILEDALHGTKGTFIKKINSSGAQLDIMHLENAVMGKNIITTLDLPLQLIAEEIFPEGASGCLLLMDPTTGALKVTLSHPQFDPTCFLNPINNETWQELTEKGQFLNRAFNVCYPPASLFKLVSISAALEEGLTHVDATWYCRGHTRFGMRTYHCAKRTGHGRLDLKEAVAHSCNIPFYELAKRISIDTLADYAHRFGLGAKTNIMFPEKQGLVPTNAWKKQEKGERWWPGETLSAIIGQSFLLVTPIQIACMVSSIFTGYLVKPRVLEQEIIDKKPLDISVSTRSVLKKAMKLALIEGTSRSINRLRSFKMYAKTGTAQTRSRREEEDDDDLDSVHAYFVAYFIYKDEPPLTLVIFVERAGSSRIATRVAKQFFLRYRAYKEQQSI